MTGALLRSLAVGVLIFLSSLGLRIWVVDGHAKIRQDRPARDATLLKSPGYDVVQLMGLEHQEGFADVMWLGVVQHIGAGTNEQPSDWDRVQRLADLATDFDPRYFVIYHATAINLTGNAARIDASDELLLKGVKVLPHRFELPFMLGYNAYFFHASATAAADYWLSAARKPGAPPYLSSLAGRVRFQAGDRVGSIQVLEAMLENLPEGSQRDFVKDRLLALKSESILEAYDEACTRFQTEKGRLPAAGVELYESGYVTLKPVDLYGAPITLDKDCRARSKWITVREDEAAKRVGQHKRTLERFQKMRSPAESE